MSIKRVEFTYKKTGLRYDRNSKKYIGWQIDVRSSKKRHRNLFPTKREAELFIDELQKQLPYKKAGLKVVSRNAPMVSDVFAERLKAIANHSERVRAKRVFAYFSGILEFPLTVTAVRSSHFQLYINARQKDGIRPESINREINILSSAFKRAAEMFPTVLEDYEPPRVVRPRFKQRRRERVITEAENAAILSYLYQEQASESDRKYNTRVRIGRMWQLAWLLGLRYSEVTRLVKSDYNRANRTLRVVRWKTGNVTLFEHLPDAALELLDAAVASSDSDFILSLSGSTPTMFYKLLKAAVESAGLTWGREGIDSITFHTLRHSFITRLVQATDIATAASFSGHVDGSEMIALYSHASPESRRKAMAALYGKNAETKLREIYESVRSGDMDLEAFLTALR